jgi:hypothetical protein
MAEVLREGPTLRVILADGATQDPALVVEKVKAALLDKEVVEVVIEIPGSDMTPRQPVVVDLIQELESETLAHGVSLRFSL